MKVLVVNCGSSSLKYQVLSMFLQAANFPIDAIRSQIGEALDIIVHLGKMPDNKRKVLEIAEIAGMSNGRFILNSLFNYSLKAGLERSDNPLINREKIMLNGRLEDGCFEQT